jgi:hypothetical protein
MRAVLVFALVLLLAPARSADSAPGARFTTIDVMVECDRPLAAWQVQLKVTSGDAVVVGVEGGEAPFGAAPFYDPEALGAGRLILAAFDTQATLPAGRHRLATLHLREAGPAPAYELGLEAAADPTGARIPATVTLVTKDSTP